jgi:murein DD-endopeptidase MepM/ murein hydrolase activator NlpD
MGVGVSAACGGSSSREPTPIPDTASPVPTRSPTPPSTATPAAEPSPTPIPAPTPAAIHPGPPEQPLGFPIDPEMALGLVVGEVGSRTIEWGAGPGTLSYTRDDQPSDDPARANRCGWNARVHVAYEGQPAVDWYIPGGTPVTATMNGIATLLVNTVSNPFDVYGVAREPYIGNPDRSRAPISPFPGPGGGQGVFVRVQNASFVTDYAHLDLLTTLGRLPAPAFLAGYEPGMDYESLFRPLRDYRVATAIARWPVQRGDTIGFSADTGYSEAPHLHYTVRRAGAGNLLCPTTEAGFADNGWLLK